jgi:predicted O-methyltransferase YrrM
MKRNYKHLTIRYIVNRLKQEIWMRNNSEHPWLSKQACEFLSDWLKPEDNGIEWGSGRSTLWIAKRLNNLISIEHHLDWYNVINKTLQIKNIYNIDYRLVSNVQDCKINIADYCIKPFENYKDNLYDFILIDGIYRDQCALSALNKVRAGGIIMIDDAHRYLPSNSTAPYAIPKNSRCLSPSWDDFLNQVKSWRRIWLSDGIYVTAVFFKPEHDKLP